MDGKNQPKKRTQLSFIIRDPIEKLNRSGINCIRFEDSKNQADRQLFTAGRDSIIRVYNNFSYTNNDTGVDVNNGDRYYQMSLSHHTDWVNDIVVCKNYNTIFSASSDTTVKVWNSTNGSLLNTLKLHKDYVKCLSYAQDKNLLASAGFDKNIFIWDVQTGAALNSSGLDFKTINDNKYSIYSLAMNKQGTVLASGSPENCIRLWDPRSCSKTMKLKGHTHNIRTLILNRDGTQLLSASSDHTIRLWSLGQQRCISTIEIHTEGVWSMCVNDSFTKVYSGGKDCRVYSTDLKNHEDAMLICEETAPILSMDFGQNQDSLWVATSNSSIKNWSLKPNDTQNANLFKNQNKNSSINQSASPNHVNICEKNSDLSLGNTLSTSLNDQSNKSESSSLTSFLLQNPINVKPLVTIKGTASIKQYHILNDKRNIVTKDSDENVSVWDVLQAKRTESLGKEDYEHAIKQRQRFISIPNWFTVDLKLGLLTISLDENEWYSAWINFKDMDSNHVRGLQSIDLSEAKVNYGCIFLESLFKNCVFINPMRIQTCETVVYSNTANNASKANEEDGTKSGLLRFNIPEHTPIIFSEISGRTLLRTEVKELSRESEQETLSSVIPLWIIDAIVNKNNPKFNRLTFMLNPYNQSTAKTLNKDRLSSIDLLQVKKVKEHVYQKILKLDENINQQSVTQASNTDNSGNTNVSQNASSDNNSANSKHSSLSNSMSNNSNSSSNANTNDLSTLANRTIELICSDNILNDSEMSLRTIKHLIWKGSGDLTIMYRIKA